jgi:proline iminopeptidase
MPMDKFSGQKRAAAHLFPPIDPFDQRMLDVGDGHRFTWSSAATPEGAPVIVLHGGPGGGCSPGDAAVFQPRGLAHHPVRPARLRSVAAPCQRRGNTTWHLVRRYRAYPEHAGDRTLDRLRRKLGRDAGLIYAETHPDRGRSRCAASS